MRILVIGGHEAGVIADALIQRGMDAVVLKKEENMGILGRHSGLSRLALAIASMIVAQPSVVFNLAREADYQVKNAAGYPTGANGRNHGPQRQAYGQPHPAIQTRRHRNSVRRSSMNLNPDL